MAEGTTLSTWTGSAAGPVIATEQETISATTVQVQQNKLVFGDVGTFTGAQGGRNTDGSSTVAAGFIDVRPNVKDVTSTPTITNGSAYAAGNVLGTKIDFGALARASGSPLYIVSATIIDNSQQNAAIDLFLFNANPSNGTYTDKSTPTFNATDAAMVRGVIPFGAYANIGSGGSVCSVPNVGLSIVPNAQSHLYGLMIVRTTPTYGATTAITVCLEYVAD